MMTQPVTPQPPAPPDFLNAPGEMAALIRSINWSESPLGPPAAWPQSLRTALSICLHSHFPILLWWGPELIMLYNDAYRPMLGSSKHPAAMGLSGREGWDDVWHIIGPMLEGVIKEGKATWSENQMLPLDRNGYVEECFFTFSYSPISDESGGIGGVFCAVTETTAQVIAARRMVILKDLAAHAGAASTQALALALAADTLAQHPGDLPFGLIYRLDAENKSAVLEAAINLPAGTELSPERIDLAASGQIWPLATLLADTTQPCLLLEQLDERYATLPGGFWPEHARQVLILPLQQEQQHSMYGFFVAGISPRHAFDEACHTFLSLVGDQLSSALTRAAAYEHEYQRAQALAEIDRAKTDFFANVSHEFRTPLTLMLAPLEDALSTAQPSIRGEDLNILHRNALRLLKLVNTLLDFSRIEAGRIKASYRPTDLAVFTADLASMFRSAVEKAGLALHIHCPPLAEPVYIDPDMWEKIVLNLLSNAFKFTFAGEISVSLVQAGRMVELTVQDTGTGIAEEELPHVFTRFHRIRQARSRTHEGSGIGNALVKELVERHGGSIEVESRLGQGTSFRVRIPLGKEHLPQEQIETASSLPVPAPGANAYVEEALRWLPEKTSAAAVQQTWNLGAYSSTMRCPGKGTDASKRILVVDDNADMRQYLEKLLRSCWQVEAFADGASALQAAMENPPDLILTDIMMPEMDGLELLEHLRMGEKTRRIPIIIISARAGEEAYIKGVDTGADDYIIKPFSPRELLAKIGANLLLAQIRQEADREIIANEKRLRAYIETSFASVYQMSPGWHEMTLLAGNGFLAETLLHPGTNWLETHIHPGDQGLVLNAIQESVRQKQLFETEFRIVLNDGTTGWMHSRAVPVLDEHGDIIEWIGTARDITERKKTEQRLQEKSAEFLAILEQLPLGFVVLDNQGHVTMCNAIMRPYTGDTIPALDPHQSKKLKVFDTEGNPLPLDLWPGPQALRGTAVYGLETAYSHDDGRVEWHLVSAVPVKSDDGETAGAIVVLQNISKLKKTEQELREINEHLDRLVQVRTAAAEEKTAQLRSLTAQLIEVEENERRKFAELLHDDLQQIIGAAQVQIQSLTETLPHSPVLSDIAQLLHNAIAQTRYLSNEISPPVLYHAGLASGMRWLAARMRDQFQLEVTVAIAKQIRIDNVPLKRFIFRAAQELLYNVVKHADTSSAHVSLTESGDSIILAVSDGGAGFDPAAQRGAQAGFGLVTIQERARYMGGAFTIESAAGQGSRLTLRLPNPDKSGTVHRRRASDRINDPDTSLHEESHAVLRVLVVDDHRLMRKGLVNLLHGQSGIEVIGEAGNGQKALDQTRTLHPDVVLMDISMPVLGGIEATRRLKKEFPAVRVIGLSMHQDHYISEHMRSAGAEAVLTKTAGASELIKAIQGSEK